MEERDYAEFARLAGKLGLPMLQAFIELEVSKDGLVIGTLKQRSHSWTRNAYNWMFSQLAGKNTSDSTFEAGKLSMKNTDGQVKFGASPSGLYCGQNHDTDTSYGYRAPAADDAKGILVGSGTDAETFEDYVLQTKIANGSGAGQLAYVESELHSVSYEAGTKTLKNSLVRYFNNNSGAAIGVNEVGIVYYGYLANTPGNALVSRDKLGTTVSVPDTGQLKVTYTIQLVYPA